MLLQYTERSHKATIIALQGAASSVNKNKFRVNKEFKLVKKKTL